MVGDPVEGGGREDRVDGLGRARARPGRTRTPRRGRRGACGSRSTIAALPSTATTAPFGTRSSSTSVTRPVPQPASSTRSSPAQVEPVDDVARHRELRVGDAVVGGGVPFARRHTYVRYRIRSVPIKTTRPGASGSLGRPAGALLTAARADRHRDPRGERARPPAASGARRCVLRAVWVSDAVRDHRHVEPLAHAGGDRPRRGPRCRVWLSTRTTGGARVEPHGDVLVGAAGRARGPTRCSRATGRRKVVARARSRRSRAPGRATRPTSRSPSMTANARPERISSSVKQRTRTPRASAERRGTRRARGSRRRRRRADGSARRPCGTTAASAVPRAALDCAASSRRPGARCSAIAGAGRGSWSPRAGMPVEYGQHRSATARRRAGAPASTAPAAQICGAAARARRSWPGRLAGVDVAARAAGRRVTAASTAASAVAATGTAATAAQAPRRAAGGRSGGGPRRAARPRGRARSRSCPVALQSWAQAGEAARDALADDGLRRAGAARRCRA